MHHDPKHHRSPDFFNVLPPSRFAFSPRSALLTADHLPPRPPQPDRYISYHLASAESASLADPHAPDHWILGVR